jgi:hypothetical protein
LRILVGDWLFCIDPDDENCDHPWEDPNAPS